MSDKKEKDFKVEDKRLFSIGENGTIIEKSSKEKESEKASEEKVEEKKKDEQKVKEIPEATFSNFVLSLNAQALVFLGVLPHPETNRIEANVLLAKHTIDLLEILKEKTKGNLTQEEVSLIDDVLFRLRVVYVEVQKKGEKK